MSLRAVSLEEYAALAARCDVGPNYSPRFVEYYFSRLGIRPKLLGSVNREGELVAGFPVHLFQVFPNPIHRRLLGRRILQLGDFGQPELLFPVVQGQSAVHLGRFSPTTSSLLKGRVRRLSGKSLRSVAIARHRKHKNRSAKLRQFLAEGGRVHFSEDMSPTDFADAFLELHSQRWALDCSELVGVRRQVETLYGDVFGVVLQAGQEPVAALLAFRNIGTRIYYIDCVSSGARLRRPDGGNTSYGSILMLCALEKAEKDASLLGKELRFSLGYYDGDHTYKAQWAEPEPTFIGY